MSANENDEGARPTSEAEAREMLRYLSELYDIPEESLRRAAEWIGVRCMFESEVLLAQTREAGGWLTIAESMREKPPKPWRKRDDGA